MKKKKKEKDFSIPCISKLKSLTSQKSPSHLSIFLKFLSSYNFATQAESLLLLFLNLQC